jgi:hypothetical protein
MAGTNKGRIGLILKIKGSVQQATELRHECRHGGDFPPTAEKAELAFRNGHYYF